MSFNYKLTQDIIWVLSETEMTIDIANRGPILVIGYMGDGRPEDLFLRGTWNIRSTQRAYHIPRQRRYISSVQKDLSL